MQEPVRRIKVSQLAAVVLLLAAICAFYLWRGIASDYIAYKMLLGAIIFVCLVNGLRDRVKVNPYLLFSITPLSLLLYDDTISNHYLITLSQNTYLFAIANFIALLVGFSLMKKLRCNAKAKVWGKGTALSRGALSRYAYILIAIGLTPTAWGLFTGFGFLVGGNLNGLKEAVNAAPLSSVISLFLYPGIVCAIKSKRAKTIVWVTVWMAISVLFNFSKTTVSMMFISILITLYTESIDDRTRKRKRRLFVLSLVALFVVYESFGIYNYIRHNDSTNLYFLNLGYIDNISSAGFLPYMYLISPWSNLQYITDTVTQHTYGLWLVKPLVSYLQLDNLLGIQYVMVPRFSAFNTFTYISVFYIDFGYVGSVVCSFFFGMFIMWIYRLYLRFRQSPYAIAVWSLNAYAVLLLFFNNHYLQLSYPLTIIIITWIWLKLTRQRQTA